MTDELKKSIENTQSDEVRNAAAKKSEDGMKPLSDEELDKVAGGFLVKKY